MTLRARQAGTSLAVALAISTAAVSQAEQNKVCPDILNHSIPSIVEQKQTPLCDEFSGQVLLVVNTASGCGYTPQFEGLQSLHDKYAAQGFSVVGFPSNDFRQEKATDEEVAIFCKSRFNVSFPMFTRSSVKGPDANSFYKALNTKSGQQPRWNFFKYLIDREGKIVDLYASSVAPDDKQLIAAIETALK